MLFLFKKIIGVLAMPLPVTICVLLFSLVCHFFLKKKKWALFFFIGFLGLFFAQTTVFVPRMLLSPLEQAYPVFSSYEGEMPPVDYIVVLGGGQVVNPAIPATEQLNYSSLVRVVEAVRLSRLHPATTILFSGGKVFETVPVAVTMAAAAQELGLASDRIDRETATMDTESQARVISMRMGTQPFLLVTSASHMPRAMLLFHNEGARPIPAPCGHWIKREGDGVSWSDVQPQAEYICMMERAIYEWLGLLLVKAKALFLFEP